MYFKGMAKELAPHGIRVNCYCPGIHDTKMWQEVDESLGAIHGREKGESLKHESAQIALGRTGEPDDVAKLVAFLARDESEYITGYACRLGLPLIRLVCLLVRRQSIIVDGGIVFT